MARPLLKHIPAFERPFVAPQLDRSTAAQRPEARRLLLCGQRPGNPKQIRAFTSDAIGLNLLGECPYKNTDDLVEHQGNDLGTEARSAGRASARPPRRSARRSGQTAAACSSTTTASRWTTWATSRRR